MIQRLQAREPAVIPVLVLMVALQLLSALVISQTSGEVALVFGCGIAIGLVAFIRTDLAISLLILSMLLSPEFSPIGASSSEGRGVTFRLDDILLVVVCVSWLIKSAINKELPILRKTPLYGVMFLYIGICLISTLIGVAGGRVNLLTGLLFVTKFFQYFVLFFMIVNHLRDERQIKRYLLIFIVTALIVSTFGLLQIPSGERVTAPFEGSDPEPNTLGGYLGFVILICFALAISLREIRPRILLLFCVAYMLLPFLFTLSRASYLGFLPGLLTILIISRKHVITAVLGIAVLSLFLFPGLLPGAVQKRIAFTWGHPARIKQAAVMVVRLDMST